MLLSKHLFITRPIYFIQHNHLHYSYFQSPRSPVSLFEFSLFVPRRRRVCCCCYNNNNSWSGGVTKLSINVLRFCKGVSTRMLQQQLANTAVDSHNRSCRIRTIIYSITIRFLLCVCCNFFLLRI